MISDLTRDDIYNLIVPIVVALIGWLLPYLKGNFKVEKQWKYVSEKSACDMFLRYCLRVFILGLLTSIIYIAVILGIIVLFEVEASDSFIKISYAICISIAYIFFAKNMKEDDIHFKKEYKYRERIASIMNKVPHVLAWAIWLSLFSIYVPIVMRMIVVLTVIFEVVIMIIIDDARTFKFKYATFHFYDDKTIKCIETCNIFQKGAWIIAKKEVGNMEHRFRIKDIKHIEYSNSTELLV